MKAIQKCLLIIDNPRSQTGEQLEWPSSNRLKKKKYKSFMCIRRISVECQK